MAREESDGGQLETTEDKLPPILAELFILLPPEGAVWTWDERSRWFDAFRAIAALLWPVPKEGK